MSKTNTSIASACKGQRNKQTGATMIEVLITVVVLAVGLLGIAALQLTSKKSNFEAVQRTAASLLAQDILERMRANPGRIGNVIQPLNVYAGTLEAPAADITGSTFGSEPAPNCNAVGAECNELQLATHDLWELEQSLIGAAVTDAALTANFGGLAMPIACINSQVPAAQVIPGTPTQTRAGLYRITIAWRGQTDLGDPDPLNTCGRASGNYDKTAGNNEYRRMLVVDTVISQIEEFN